MNTNNLISSINLKLSNSSELILNDTEKEFLQIYQPEKHFIVYGTLAPNRPNHHKVEHISGTWHDGIVKGKLISKGWGAELGYNAFKHCSTDESTDIQAFILVSEELPQNWPALDDFEGEEYKRILAKYELADGTQGVGYIYSLNE